MSPPSQPVRAAWVWSKQPFFTSIKLTLHQHRRTVRQTRPPTRLSPRRPMAMTHRPKRRESPPPFPLPCALGEVLAMPASVRARHCKRGKSRNIPESDTAMLLLPSPVGSSPCGEGSGVGVVQTGHLRAITSRSSTPTILLRNALPSILIRTQLAISVTECSACVVSGRILRDMLPGEAGGSTGTCRAEYLGNRPRLQHLSMRVRWCASYER
jgi:hypothetical protein